MNRCKCSAQSVSLMTECQTIHEPPFPRVGSIWVKAFSKITREALVQTEPLPFASFLWISDDYLGFNIRHFVPGNDRTIPPEHFRNRL
jgi:hypothetical protein